MVSYFASWILDNGVMPTSQQWLEVRAHLLKRRHELAVEAAGEYSDVPRVAGTPLLTAPQWMPAAPVPLADLTLSLETSVPFGGFASDLLPDGFLSYSEAMAALAAPSVFENRETYRLLDFALPHLTFGIGSYFDGIDVGEACAHEYAARSLGVTDELRLRSSIGNPCDPAR
ncbi:MAG: hypothetical protein QOF58_4582, partial [Pseudonocardiales bacterium]|nr:hypothetical protein [Pseudonocardiales bacterium]